MHKLLHTWQTMQIETRAAREGNIRDYEKLKHVMLPHSYIIFYRVLY